VREAEASKTWARGGENVSSKQDMASLVNVLRSIDKRLEAIANLLTPVDSIQMRLGEIRNILVQMQKK
jgi:hypothetical protein